MKKALDTTIQLLNICKHDEIIIEDGKKYIPTSVIKQHAHALLLELRKMEFRDNELIKLCHAAENILNDLKGNPCLTGS